MTPFVSGQICHPANKAGSHRTADIDGGLPGAWPQKKNDVICVMSMMTTSDDIISMAREMHGDGDSGTLNAC